ncbi:MAG: hypothetical protein AAF654_10225 [Myxococcota bacterium]
MSQTRFATALIAIAFMSSACGDDETSEALEIEGVWLSNFSTTDTITSTMFNSQTIISFSNSENFAITQNPPDDAFFPDKFSRIVWTEPANDTFFYCTIDFGLDTAAEAENSPNVADATDPETMGCGTFPWTRLERAP